MPSRTPAALLLSALALAVVAPLAASAAPAEGEEAPVTWSVEPIASAAGDRGLFEYAVEPGTQITDTIVISNFGTADAAFLIYATDAINDFETGAFGLLTRDEKPVDVGSWITLDIDTITLAPGAEARVPFQLLVPSDAEPGDHVAGIVASVLSDDTTEGEAVALEQRVGSRVYLTVAGVPDVGVEAVGLVSGFAPSLNPFAPGTLDLDYAVTNTGNLRLDVTQEIDVTGPFGIPLGTITPEPVSNILPGQSVHVTAQAPAVLALALAWSTVTLTPSAAGSAAAEAEAAAEVPATDTTPAAGDESIEEVVDGPVFESSTASSLSLAVSWTLLSLVVLAIVVLLLVWRYVTGTRERMYDAIDRAREDALLEATAARADEKVTAP